MVSTASTFTTVAQQGFRLTGEQIAFGLAFLMITAVLLLFTHAWIASWFVNEKGRKDGMTHFATWSIITLLVAVTFFVSSIWWFNYDGSGLRPVVQQWLTSNGWNIR
jgi:hypothetical protein